ncbi:hypothetical protein SNA_06310 [Streptomyces natalensis ATCC 27448]|uniref:Chaplin domain-containing protein n=1 Tax=Streptomyces natalensis ATCC 27448 TaxID=1240678 RepID=A0A0D7CTZ8_9ACTN|nr:hypothetical protein SNA_06310 [Streptomyces natalensis ATCC 27448]
MAASAAAGGLLLASAGTTVADSGAKGAAIGSPGVVSGNVLQVPVHIPINVCGNTVGFVGALNAAFHNTCVNVSGHHHGHGGGGAQAKGVAAHSPGVLSGNLVQIPVDIPVNACGNSGDVIGILNPAFGNRCANVEGPGHRHHHKQSSHTPPQHHHHHHKSSEHHRQHVSQGHHQMAPPVTTPAIGHHPHAVPALPQLAKTGAEERIALGIPVSAALVISGVLLYRRGRRAAARD